MESVRKAAEMVIEEVQFKGNSKCLFCLSARNPGQCYTRPPLYSHTRAQTIATKYYTVYLCVTFHDETPPRD